MNKEQFISKLTVDICELPDRTSPEDQPDMMLVTGKELHGLASNLLECSVIIPDALTTAMQEAMSLMPWVCGAIAEVMRRGGAEIARKCEAEQAHVLFWALKLAVEHGDKWRDVGMAELKAIRERTNQPATSAAS